MMKNTILFLLVTLCCLLSGTAACHADEPETLLYTTSGSYVSGQPAPAGVTISNTGTVYGVSYNGGDYGKGTVFEILPNGVPHDLYDFGAPGTNGQNPVGNLLIDSQGNLYGATLHTSSTNHNSALFFLPVNSDGSYGPPYVSNQFDASYRNIRLSWYKEEKIVGTASGTAGNNSIVFLLNASPRGFQNYQVICAVPPVPGTVQQLSGITTGSHGSLYGTWNYGGAYGDGEVYKLTGNANGSFTCTVLHSFTGSLHDGSIPLNGVTLDSNGNIYGVTSQGGQYNCGTVYALLRSATGYSYNIIHSFAGKDGKTPECRMYLSPEGILYGTTMFGGKNQNTGTFFSLSLAHPAPFQITGVLHSLGSLGVQFDDGNPAGTLSADKQGLLYLTTMQGNVSYSGTVVRFGPSITETGPNTLSSIPQGGLLLKVYGTGFTPQDLLQINGISYTPEVISPYSIRIDVQGSVLHTGANIIKVVDPALNSSMCWILPIGSINLNLSLVKITQTATHNYAYFLLSNQGTAPAVNLNLLYCMYSLTNNHLSVLNFHAVTLYTRQETGYVVELPRYAKATRIVLAQGFSYLSGTWNYFTPITLN